jgi:hypothetical protein
MTMAKDATTPNVSPLFTFGRTVIAEMETQADRWLDYSLAQQQEALKIAKTLRSQAISATKSAFDAAEQLFAKGAQ